MKRPDGQKSTDNDIHMNNNQIVKVYTSIDNIILNTDPCRNSFFIYIGEIRFFFPMREFLRHAQYRTIILSETKYIVTFGLWRIWY